MKKTVVTLLLILPLLLIYFISFSGRILSTYTYVGVERIALYDENGDEYKENSTITIGKDQKIKLNIKVFPEMAKNKTVKITNSNKNICQVDTESNEVMSLNYGTSTLMIISNDRSYVQFVIKIEVADYEIEDIGLPARLYNEAEDRYELKLTKGQTENIDTTILPDTTLPENRNLVWEDFDKTIIGVKDGLIEAKNIGKTTIKVRSDHKPEVFKIIYVEVVLDQTKDVYFINENPNMIYKITSSEFDLKSITAFNKDGLTFDDIIYEETTEYSKDQVDLSKISEGLIEFKEKGAIITISIRFKNSDYILDTLILKYVGGG